MVSEPTSRNESDSSQSSLESTPSEQPDTTPDAKDAATKAAPDSVSASPAASDSLLPELQSAIAYAQGLSKFYGKGDYQVRALDQVSVTFERSKFTAIMGPSGSGKSTLMHCMAALDNPTDGQVFIDGHSISQMSDKRLTRLRRDKLGFVFQAFNLVPTLSARENILLPLHMAGKKPDPEWFGTVINAVGLQDRLTHKPNQLSGGQQQRVACARALVSKPAVVFADEPTGNLDSRASTDILQFLRKSVDEFGQSVVMVTHDPSAAAYADRVLFLSDGKIVDEVHNPTAGDILQKMAILDSAHSPDLDDVLGKESH